MDFLSLKSEVLVVFSTGEESCDCLKAIVQTVEGREKIILEQADSDKVKHLKENLPVEIIILAEENLFSIYSKVLEVDEEAKLIVISYPATYKKVQRREYTRMNVELPIEFSLISDDMNLSKQVFNSRTLDLSGGGISFMSPIPLERNVLLVARIKLMNTEVHFTAAVVRCVESDQIVMNDTPAYTLATFFAKIDQGSQLTIIQFCFKKQLELKHLGLAK